MPLGGDILRLAQVSDSTARGLLAWSNVLVYIKMSRFIDVTKSGVFGLMVPLRGSPTKDSALVFSPDG
jgi:hypothetical protein